MFLCTFFGGILSHLRHQKIAGLPHGSTATQARSKLADKTRRFWAQAGEEPWKKGGAHETYEVSWFQKIGLGKESDHQKIMTFMKKIHLWVLICFSLPLHLTPDQLHVETGPTQFVTPCWGRRARASAHHLRLTRLGKRTRWIKTCKSNAKYIRVQCMLKLYVNDCKSIKHNKHISNQNQIYIVILRI